MLRISELSRLSPLPFFTPRAHLELYKQNQPYRETMKGKWDLAAHS
jgi:hypothetical protein